MASRVRVRLLRQKRNCGIIPRIVYPQRLEKWAECRSFLGILARWAFPRRAVIPVKLLEPAGKGLLLRNRLLLFHMRYATGGHL